MKLFYTIVFLVVFSTYSISQDFSTKTGGHSYKAAKQLLDSISVHQLEQRAYLFYGCLADYYDKTGDQKKAIHSLKSAINQASNELEKNYMTKKKELLLTKK